jgi:hypothetical protein
MPSGGNTPLEEDSPEWRVVMRDFDEARKQGMQYEWLRWMLGGIINNKLDVKEASNNACIEWDF